MKKHLLLISAMFFSIAITFAQGGTVGPLTWNLSGSTLTISGNGAMPDFDYYDYIAPWCTYCNTITAVVITNGVTKIGHFAFHSDMGDFYKLTSVTLPNSLISIGCAAFHSSDLTSISFPNSLTTIWNSAFEYCNKLTSITLPNSQLIIGNNAFSSCDYLATVTISENVKSIEYDAFRYCSRLETVNYNAINCAHAHSQKSMFSNTITTLNIGNMVQVIPEYTFYGCTKLSSLTIPNSVKSIKGYAFAECTGLTSITANAIAPPLLSSNAFQSVSTSIPIYIPCESYDSYISASGWGNYFTNINGEGAADKQQICMISVNESNQNEIIWKKQEEVVSYKIYREEIQSGEYDLVATVDYNAPNIWVDTESNAKIHSYSYKISADNNVCESILSDAHQTMYLAINAGAGNSWHLDWTAYEGIEYSTYNIYRSSGETIDEWQFIGSMPFDNTTFSDLSAPGGYVYYMVEIWLNETCTVGKGSSILSNIATNNPNVAINENTAEKITIYPNPTTSKLKIESGELRVENVEIFDIYGKQLSSHHLIISSSHHTIDISHLSAGFYFAKIHTEKGEVVRKVVKE